MANIKMNSKLIIIIVAALALIIAGCGQKDDSGVNGATTGNTSVITVPSGTGSTGENPDLSVRCGKDSDCGKDFYSEPYCFQGHAVTPVTKDKCIFPNTVKSYCTKEKTELTTLCDKSVETCRKGSCLKISELPCSDSDSGKNYYKRGTLVDGLFEEQADDCDGDVLTEWYCSDGTKGFARSEQYDCPRKCITGACVD